MRIAVLDETKGGEPRVAATPETIGKLKPFGASFIIEKGAGNASSISDAAFEAAGAKIAKTAAEALKDADVVLAVRRPKGELAAKMKPGAIVLAIMDPYGNAEALQPFAERGVATFAMGANRLLRPVSNSVLISTHRKPTIMFPIYTV